LWKDAGKNVNYENKKRYKISPLKLELRFAAAIILLKKKLYHSNG
jgi:hypothetical protein